MGLAPDAMGWKGLMQAVPPAYAAYVFGQQVQAWLHRHRGLPDVPYGCAEALDTAVVNMQSIHFIHHWRGDTRLIPFLCDLSLC